MRDFAKKTYRNPFYAEKKSLRKHSGENKYRFWIFIVLFASIIVLAIWLVRRGQQFAITNIEIVGASSSTESVLRGIIQQQEQQTRIFFFPQKNIFFFNESLVESKIRAKFYFDSLVIRKKIPHTLVVEVKEKPLNAIFLQQSQFLALDEKGFVIRDLDEAELKSLVFLPNEYMAILNQSLGVESVSTSVTTKTKNPYPVIVDDVRELNTRSGVKKRPGINVVSTSALAIIVQSADKLQATTGSPTQWFWIKEGSETVDASVQSGWEIYFTANTPFETQNQRLNVVLKEKLSTQRGSIEYVDLRYDERVFYKLKTAPATKPDETRIKK